jgi:predicted Zn finger-like uncharacterized protein
MTVHCPHCLTGYELPAHLMGAQGARVRCPGCQGVFVVLPEGRERPEAPGPQSEALPEPRADQASASAEAARTGPSSPVYEPAVVACAVIDVMVDFLGEALNRARARGTVLSEHGPAIVAVWEEYRRRAGAEAPAAEFRAALRDRVGIDLTPRAGG